jgi:hypothetical protein
VEALPASPSLYHLDTLSLSVKMATTTYLEKEPDASTIEKTQTNESDVASDMASREPQEEHKVRERW